MKNDYVVIKFKGPNDIEAENLSFNEAVEYILNYDQDTFEIEYSNRDKAWILWLGKKNDRLQEFYVPSKFNSTKKDFDDAKLDIFEQVAKDSDDFGFWIMTRKEWDEQCAEMLNA